MGERRKGREKGNKKERRKEEMKERTREGGRKKRKSEGKVIERAKENFKAGMAHSVTGCSSSQERVKGLDLANHKGP